MTQAPIVKIIISGILIGILFQSTIIRFYAHDPNEYCDFHGIYSDDSADMYDIIKKTNYTTGGMLYAYVCNNNKLNISALRSFEKITQYGIIQGNVTTIPSSIANLSELTFLQVQDQELSRLPVEIGSLRNLEFLKLAGNNLTSLPRSIGNLTHLKSLELQSNNLLSIPEEVYSLKSLELLDLRNNPNLHQLPQKITLLKNIKHMYLGDTNISKNQINQLKTALPDAKIYD